MVLRIEDTDVDRSETRFEGQLVEDLNWLGLDWPQSDAVLSRFTYKILEDESACEHQLTRERFTAIVSEVQAETGAKGKELFHPIRIVVTGSHSGPEFDKVIPILEEGSRLKLSRRVLSVRERVEAFAAVRTKAAS